MYGTVMYRVDWNFSQFEEFEWDEGNLGHVGKHGVSAEDCEEAFGNKPRAIRFDRAHSQAENRFEFLGKTSEDKKIFFVFTVRNSKIRIFSARLQSKKERRFYEKVEENTGS